MSKYLLYTAYTCTCIARSLRTFSYKHPFGVQLSPKSLIISSKLYDSNTSDSMLMTIILAAYGCKARSQFSKRTFTVTVCHNRNRNLQTPKAPLKSQAQGTSLFTSAASNRRDFPKNSPWEVQVRFPEGQRMRQIRVVFQRIVRGKLRSSCQKVRGGRLGVKAGVVQETSGNKQNQVSQRKRV